MTTERLEYLFDRYLQKKETPAERQELMQLIAAAEHDDKLKAMIDEVMEATAVIQPMPAHRKRTILNRLYAAGAVALAPVVTMQGRRKWWSVAAVLIGIMGMAATWYLLNRHEAEPWEQVETAMAQNRFVRLPDGTQVWLSPSSRINYPAQFTGATREVHLTGEAFFEVAPDSRHRFVVHSASFNTHVLGTSFNMKVYPGKNEPVVQVVSGKVAVAAFDKKGGEVGPLELTAQEQVQLDSATGALVKQSMPEAGNLLQRREGKFIYKNTPLSQLAADLQSYFGVEVAVAPAIAQCKVVASFNLKNEVPDILEMIALTIDAKLDKNGAVYQLTGSGCRY